MKGIEFGLEPNQSKIAVNEMWVRFHLILVVWRGFWPHAAKIKSEVFHSSVYDELRQEPNS